MNDGEAPDREMVIVEVEPIDRRDRPESRWKDRTDLIDPNDTYTEGHDS